MFLTTKLPSLKEYFWCLHHKFHYLKNFKFFIIVFHVTVNSLLQLSSYVRFFENVQKYFNLGVFLLFKFKRLRKMGFSCWNIEISITLKAFLKHTCQCQIAFLLLLCKEGNIFDLFFQEQLKEKTLIKIKLICFLAVIHTLIKRCSITKKYLTTHYVFREKKQYVVI